MYASPYSVRVVLFLWLAGCASNPHPPEEQRVIRAAETMANKGNMATAIRMYEQILDKTENKVPVLLALAKAYLEDKNLGAAKKSYETVLSMAPNNDEAKKGLARCYILAGNPQIALSLYKEILPTCTDAQTYTGAGVAYSLLGDHPAATNFFRKALQQDPKNTDYINNLALSLGSNGQTKEALDLLKPIASPVYAPEKFKNNLATLYELDGQTHKARNLFLQTVGPTGADMNMKALQQIPTHPVHFNRPAVEGKYP